MAEGPRRREALILLWTALFVPSGSRSLNVRGRKPLQLAAKILAKLLDFLGSHLRIRLGGLHQSGGERLARGTQVGFRLGAVARAPQREGLLLGVLGEGGEPLAVR